MRVDLSGLGPITSSDLRLIIDRNNDGAFSDETTGTGGVISGANSLGSNVYEFSGVTGLTNNLRFTIGTIDRVVTPLPIDFLSFKVTQQESKVKLNWVTASEINNDYFTIEKSLDAFSWTEITRVNGSGTSALNNNYEIYDEKPSLGINYYRLKQTDYNGDFSYSKIKSIQFVSQNKIIFYPNPTRDIITISNIDRTNSKIRIIDALGKDVTTFTSTESKSETSLILNVKKLSKGTYIIKINDCYSRFIKN